MSLRDDAFGEGDDGDVSTELGLDDVRRRGPRCEGGNVTLAESVPTLSRAR